MPRETIPADVKQHLKAFLINNPSAELVHAYLFFIQEKYQLSPILFTKERVIYQNTAEAVSKLEKEGKLWHEAEIKIGFSNSAVNELTKKVYICPFTGKVFGDNTHPSPQDAIYDWVSKCPENTERVGGLRVKRFFISEDPEVIQSYAAKNKPKTPITKTVYSSVINGKLFNNKEGVIEDFKKSYLKPLTLIEVQSQNKYQIDDSFLRFIQSQLEEERVALFVAALSEEEDFIPYVEKWLE